MMEKELIPVFIVPSGIARIEKVVQDASGKIKSITAKLDLIDNTGYKKTLTVTWVLAGIRPEFHQIFSKDGYWKKLTYTISELSKRLIGEEGLKNLKNVEEGDFLQLPRTTGWFCVEPASYDHRSETSGAKIPPLLYRILDGQQKETPTAQENTLPAASSPQKTQQEQEDQLNDELVVNQVTGHEAGELQLQLQDHAKCVETLRKRLEHNVNEIKALLDKLSS